MLETNGKVYDEMVHPPLSLTDNQCKLRQQRDQNSLMEGKPLQNKCKGETIETNPKEQNCVNHDQGSRAEIGKLIIWVK